MSTIVQMRLFGGFSLGVDGVPEPIPSQRLQALLAFLALRHREPQPRPRLAFLLWPDSSDTQAQTNLRTLLSRLHAVLPNADQLLQFDPKFVAWHPDVAVELDAAAFEEALRRADVAAKRADGEAARTALEQAVTDYAGDLLPDCSDEWVLTERDRLRQLLLAALENLVALLEQSRAYPAAITHARRLVHLDRLNEAACLTLMRLHSLTGNRASAVRVYHTCASALRSELGTEPGSALTTAYERLLSSESSRPSDVSSRILNRPAPLVGRDREWHRMLVTWEIAAAGQPRLLVLSGEAGIGKTRLAEELVGWASRQGILTATAHCYAAEGDLAYAPVMSWLRSDALRPSLERLDPAWLGELARLDPDVLPRRVSVQRLGPLTEKWQRQRLFEALARAVLAPGRPTQLFLDDLQWCTRDSLEWLHFLLRYNAQARVLVVATMRSEEITSDHPLAELLNTLRREGGVVEIALSPLSLEDTATLAGFVTSRSLNQAQATHLYAESEGNPLFAVEIAQAELAATIADREQPIGKQFGDGSAGHAVDLPPGVHAVIARRLSQVTPTARALLSAAAVIGRSFTFAVLQRVAKGDEDALLGALDELWQRRIVREHGPGPDAYDFTHDKLRAVTYAGLSAARRRVLHRRVAEALEVENGADLDAVCGQIALHYERASEPTKAAHYYHRAATSARRLYAHATAISNYQRALSLLGQRTTRETASLHDELGEVLHFVGRYDAAQDEWQQAIALSSAEDPIMLGHLYRKVGNARRDQYRYDDAMVTYDRAEAALGVLGTADPKAWWLAWAQLNLERITTLYWLGNIPEISRLVDQVRPAIEAYGSASLRARLYQSTTLTLLRRDRYVVLRETLESAREYYQAVKEADDGNALPAAQFLFGFILLWAGELDEAERKISAALTLAERTGDISLEGRCLTYLTVIARKRYQIELVQAFADRSLRVATAGQMPDYIGAAHGNLAWAALRLGDSSAAYAQGQEALRSWRQLPIRYIFEWVGRWPLIGVALEHGVIPEATEHAEVILNQDQQRQPSSIERELEAGTRAASGGNVEAARTHLAAAADMARPQGYL